MNLLLNRPKRPDRQADADIDDGPGNDDPTVELTVGGGLTELRPEDEPAVGAPSPELEAAAVSDITRPLDLPAIPEPFAGGSANLDTGAWANSGTNASANFDRGVRATFAGDSAILADGSANYGTGAAGHSGTGAAGRGRLRIHPRIAARWTQVRRDAGRRRLRIVVGAAAALTLGLAAIASLYTPLFAVKHVVVSGSGPVTPTQVLRFAGLSGRPPLIDVNTARLRARLDAVPQLGAASVTRQWPATVRIGVVYRSAVAVIPAPAAPPGSAPVSPEWAVVDATGRVLSDAASPPSGLPVILGAGAVPGPGNWFAGSPGPGVRPSGPGGPPVVDLNAAVDSPSAPSGLAAALAVAGSIPAPLRGDVLNITFGPGAASFAGAAGGTLSMLVLPATIASGSIPVDLGDGSELGTKLTALTTLLTEANLSGATGIDISVPNRPAVLTAR